MPILAGRISRARTAKGSWDMQFYTNSLCLTDQKTQESKQSGIYLAFFPLVFDHALESSENSKPGRTATNSESQFHKLPSSSGKNY